MKHWLTRLVKYWFIVVTVTLAGVTHAAYNPPMNLSNNNNNDTYFWIINNGDVVWSGFEGVDWDLWKYSAAANTTTQITNTSTVDEYVASANDSGSLLWIQWNNLTTTSDLMLAVSGNMQNTRKLNAKPLCSLYNSPNTLNSYGDVIWMEADALSTSCDIYLFNATTLTTTNISNSPYRDDSPLFYKGRDILWQQVVSSSFQYLLYNVATGTVTNLTTSYGVTGISERNDRGDIVWDNGATTTDAFISVYTAATNSVTTIASTVGNGLVDSIPKISPTGNIIWRQLGGPGAGASLYFKTPTGQPILIGDMGGMMTGQFMFNGDILYLGRDPVGLDYEVYIYSPTTGVNKNISNNTFDELMVWANVNGDVTWQSGGSGSAGPVDGDIFVYQAATGIVDRLTNNATADNFPVIINNGRVVWVGYDGVDSEIFYAIPATSSPINTGLRNPAANSSNSGGDGNGFQTNPTRGYLNDGLFAVDTDSGNGTSTSCTSGNKDKHRFHNYGFVIPSGVTIKGIEVRLDAKADNTSGAPKMCVELSWDGGSTWTTAKSTAALTTAEATYTLGSATDRWGRTWSTTNLSNANFRMRIINVASDISRDFSLDWAAVRVHY